MEVTTSINSLLSGIFSGEFYPSQHPDVDNENVGDFGIYKVIGGSTFNTLNGSGGIAQVRIQVSVYSLTFDRMKELLRFVESAMSIANDAASAATALGQDPYNTVGAQLNRNVAYPITGYEPDTKRHFGHIDYYLWEKSA